MGTKHCSDLTTTSCQERVKKFSELSPVALLEQTEEAVLPPEIVELHAKLIEATLERDKMEKGLLALQKDLSYKQSLNQGDELDVQKHQERQALERQAAQYGLAVSYARFALKQDEGRALRTQKEELQKEKGRQEHAMRPLKTEMNKLKEQVRPRGET